MINMVLGDSTYNSYKRDDETLIYKEDVMRRIDIRMRKLMEFVEDEDTYSELELLRAFILSTVAAM